MTPEQIVNDLQHYGKLSHRQAIEAIKQYALEFAREMCEKQRQLCFEMSKYEEDGEIQYLHTVDSNDVLNAPLPEELRSVENQ